MRRYFCPKCSNEIHFENTACLSCGSELIYSHLGDQFQLLTLPCANRVAIGCNWETDNSSLCMSCRHTKVIPDLSFMGNADRWARLERAKRMLFYSLLKFGLPIDGSDGHVLKFEFKSDELLPGGQHRNVTTGHDDGLITINIAEADDDVRERHRVAMGEPYRTLIGHFRHEIGHYYWDRLVANGSHLEAFRSMFGDERQDYGVALQNHYQSGAPLGWEKSFVSAYATAHPWEDFAETWAHYFHMVDGLETAEGYSIGPTEQLFAQGASPYQAYDFEALINAWVPLTVAMNAMNRSIGNSDFYPFVLSDGIAAKLKFIHELIHVTH
ncbi:zinc-binding metallopeptidase family protein [Aestuariivirga litoralis]|uniref:zinc-binding metallopeptidase family protein n=1 Tax=Aestuariivirga litoralis TaxID=2650924 RepID=UPI0018C7C995|nr:putative zinc-binding metallopeptidase [Aestuariivirga litoralis]MBG1232364.1 hypothetical protein [Aestuariivirga litoralis]